MQKKFRKATCCFLSALIIISFSGCMDYRGLDELTIVAGVAIDKGKNGEGYMITLEVLDTSNTSKETGKKSILIESEGKTPYEAIRNANKQLKMEMYFGNMGIFIVSHKIAEGEGLGNLMDGIMRDFDIRDTVFLIISKEETANDLLSKTKTENDITSYIIQSHLNLTRLATTSTRPYPLYKIYNYLSADANMYNLAIPAFGFKNDTGEKDKSAEEEEQKTLLSDGMAIFEKDKMIGYLEDIYMPYYLFLTEELEDGAYVFEDKDTGGNVTLEIENSKSAFNYSFENGKFTLGSDITVNCSIIEAPTDIQKMDENELLRLAEYAADSLKKDINQMIYHVQNEKQLDILGFGKYLYRYDNRLWTQVETHWNEFFSKADININCLFIMEDSGTLKSYNADGSKDK